jgi:hypothetical protein
MKSGYRELAKRSLSRTSWIPLTAFLAGLLALAGCGGKPASSSNSSPPDSHGDHAAGTTPTPRIPAHFASANEAKPFPAVLDPKQFSNPVVAKAYALAAENPEVFSQQPCYCYCDAGDNHRSLLDCFATDHGAT